MTGNPFIYNIYFICQILMRYFYRCIFTFFLFGEFLVFGSNNTFLTSKNRFCISYLNININSPRGRWFKGGNFLWFFIILT